MCGPPWTVSGAPHDCAATPEVASAALGARSRRRPTRGAALSVGGERGGVRPSCRSATWPSTPPALVAVQVSVLPARVGRIGAVLAAGVRRPDSGSDTVQSTVGAVRYQPLAPSGRGRRERAVDHRRRRSAGGAMPSRCWPHWLMNAISSPSKRASSSARSAASESANARVRRRRARGRSGARARASSIRSRACGGAERRLDPVEDAGQHRRPVAPVVVLLVRRAGVGADVRAGALVGAVDPAQAAAAALARRPGCRWSRPTP